MVANGVVDLPALGGEAEAQRAVIATPAQSGATAASANDRLMRRLNAEDRQASVGEWNLCAGVLSTAEQSSN